MSEYNKKTILLFNFKGGVGKTYLADELCYMCENSEIPYNFVNFDVLAENASQHKPRMIDDPRIEIIDTPGKAVEEVGKWIDAADLVVVPTLMTATCATMLNKVLKVLDPWQRQGKKVLIVLNCWNRYKAATDFEDWFTETHTDQRYVIISQSENIKRAVDAHKSIVNYRMKSKSAEEMMAFYKEVMFMLYM